MTPSLGNMEMMDWMRLAHGDTKYHKSLRPLQLVYGQLGLAAAWGYRDKKDKGSARAFLMRGSSHGAWSGLRSEAEVLATVNPTGEH